MIVFHPNTAHNRREARGRSNVSNDLAGLSTTIVAARQPHLNSECKVLFLRRRPMTVPDVFVAVLVAFLCAAGPDTTQADGTDKWRLSEEKVLTIEDHDASHFAALSGNGLRLVTKKDSEGPEYDVWDLTTGKRLAVLRHPSGKNARRLALSFDGSRIVTYFVGHTSPVIWDGSTGRQLARLEGKFTIEPRLAMSSDGQRIVTGYDNDLSVWGPGGTLLATMDWRHILSMDISSDATRIVAFDGDGNGILWDGQSRGPLVTLRNKEERTECVAMSSDGLWAAAGGKGGIEVWNCESGEHVWRYKGFDVDNIAISSDGSRVVASDFFDGKTTVVLDGFTGKLISRIDWAALRVSVTDNGRRLVGSGVGGDTRFIDALSGSEIRMPEFPDQWWIRLSGDGRRLVTGGESSIAVYDVARLEENAVVRSAWIPGVPHSEHLNIVAGSGPGQWDAAPGYTWLAKMKEDDWRVKWVASVPHPDHKHVMSGAEEGEWNPAPGYRWASQAKGDWRVVEVDSRDTKNPPAARRPVRERPSSPDPEVARCTTCAGTRRVSEDCHRCNGFGTVPCGSTATWKRRSLIDLSFGTNDYVTTCRNGRLKVTKRGIYADKKLGDDLGECEECNGRGEFKCTICKGRGLLQLTCRTCKGTGEMEK